MRAAGPTDAVTRRRRPALWAVLAIALSAHGPLAAANPERATRYYEDAVARADRNDPAGAIVQLKNALQQDPRMLAAQILLGKLLLQQGDAAAAEAALEQALRLGVDRTEIVLPLAQAALALGNADRVLERFGPDGLATAQRAELLIIRGSAYRMKGDLAAAAQSYRDARTLEPSSLPATLALADVLIQQRRFDDARRAIDEAVTAAPRDPQPLELRGKLALAEGNARAALEAFGQALALDSAFAPARLARAGILVDQGEFDRAERDLEALRQAGPVDPRATYLVAVIAARRGNDVAVRTALQEIVEAVDRVPREVLARRGTDLLMVGGLAYYGLNQQEKARVYFEDYLLQRPTDVGARKLLASILLTQGWPREAIDLLEPARRQAPRDANVLALLASAQMARGRFDLAGTYLEDALRLSNDAPSIQTTYGLSLLGRGQEALAMQHLEQAFKRDPKQGRAALTLAVLQLRKGERKAAVVTAEALVREEPKNPLAHNLLGAARGAAGDLAGARAAYEAALKQQPAFVPAQLNLARVDLAEGKPDAARQRLIAMHKTQPKAAQPMFELARLEDLVGNTTEAIRWLERVRIADRRHVPAAVRLVDLHLQLRAPEKALEVAKDAEGVAPASLPLLAALGRTYLALGNTELAQATFARMTRAAGFDPAWQTEIARYQRSAGNPRGAAASLERALSADPAYLPAEVMLAEVELESGDPQAAERRARAILKKHGDHPAAYRLAGDIALARKQYPAAVESYRTALQRAPDTEGALRVYRALVQAGTVEKANDFIAEWLKSHPSDQVALRALAEGKLRAGKLADARSLYEQVLKRTPEEPDVLNNLAHILLAQGDPRALEYAERAHRLAPNDASIQDTLGWTLVRQGQLDAGLRQLRDARLRAPQNPEIRFHLASALALAGRSDEARRELQPMLAALDATPSGPNARKLANELGLR